MSIIRLSHRREASLFLAALWGCLGGCQSTFPSPPIESDNAVVDAGDAAAATDPSDQSRSPEVAGTTDACLSTPSSTRKPFRTPNLAFDAAKLKLAGSVLEGGSKALPKLADCPPPVRSC